MFPVSLERARDMRRLANLWFSDPDRSVSKAASVEIRAQKQHQILVFKDRIRSLQ